MIWILRTLIMIVVASGLSGMSAAIARSGDPAPAAVGNIVGLQNPEDLLQIGDTKWLIASGLMSWTNSKDTRGHIYLIDRQTNGFEVLFPGKNPIFRQDKQLFPDCPGPINTENFSAHGFALKDVSAGRFRLYMTGHGAREAVEIFDIDARGAKPEIAWVGCVLLPEKTWGNSIAVLDDGGFLVTKSKDSSNPDAFLHLVQRRITGLVYEWHPGGSVTVVPDTELSCPNGIVTSPDGRWMYVTAMGTREVVRFDRKTPNINSRVVIPVYPDNIHWGDDGMLYTIGRNFERGKECPWMNCATGWAIVKVDPNTLTSEVVARADHSGPLQAPSAVITVGDRFWIGNFDGDRLGYMQRAK